MQSNPICPQCQGLESTFSQKLAEKELEKYNKKGPGKTTKMLIDYLRKEDIQGLRLLDIGGGVGKIQHELFKYGITQAIQVDASSSYLKISEEEAIRRGNDNNCTFIHGDFIDLAPSVPNADIVTLEFVICCYPDLERLVNLSAEHAKKFYALVFPKSKWWMKINIFIVNFYFSLKRRKFRLYVHSQKEIQRILTSNNFERCFHKSTLLDIVDVYIRKESVNTN
ncbi:MAG: class I SAM-dependent methyltransferase [Candidatus Hodarchaeales archaeon]